MLVIPAAPRELELRIERTWDGRPCPDPRRHGCVRLSAHAEGLRIGASLPHQHPARIPEAAAGSRVEDLWRYDVVECFLAGGDGGYTEVELGAGGHYLVLAFSARRRLADACAGLRPPLAHAPGPERWEARLLLPWDRVPPSLCAVNAFAIAGDAFFAHAPVPGDAPDFHQPAVFPPARLER